MPVDLARLLLPRRRPTSFQAHRKFRVVLDALGHVQLSRVRTIPPGRECKCISCSCGHGQRGAHIFAKSRDEAAELLGGSLVHLEERFDPRYDWSRWFNDHRITGRVPVAGYRTNDYSLIQRAALDGQGVTLGKRQRCAIG